jgi:hypothetical protein
MTGRIFFCLGLFERLKNPVSDFHRVGEVFNPGANLSNSSCLK